MTAEGFDITLPNMLADCTWCPPPGGQLIDSNRREQHAIQEMPITPRKVLRPERLLVAQDAERAADLPKCPTEEVYSEKEKNLLQVDENDVALRASASKDVPSETGPELLSPEGVIAISVVVRPSKKSLSSPPKTWRERVQQRLLQFAQPGEPKITLPFRWYRWYSQAACATLLAIGFAFIGGFLLLQTQDAFEVTVTYRAGDAFQNFTIDEDISGDVQVSYILEGVNMNRKEFIESKDSRVATPLFNRLTCIRSDTPEWTTFRRDGDVNFLKRIAGSGSADLLPCGLVSLSMFTDSFSFDYLTPSAWQRIEVDETDIALPGDSQTYAKRISPGADSSSPLLIKGMPSWISPGSFFEHWKVWQRTPISPSVRHLWAVIRGGLKKGTYRVVFTENSPIWQSWGVNDKLLVLSKSTMFGNKGALRFLGRLCLAIAVAEAIMMIIFLVLPFLACLERPQTFTPLAITEGVSATRGEGSLPTTSTM